MTARPSQLLENGMRESGGPANTAPLPWARSAPRIPEARVLLGLRQRDPFARFLIKALAGKSENVHYAPTREAAAEALEEDAIHIAVLESAFPDATSICTELKTRSVRAPTSVIMLYADAEEARRPPAFRVCEDEFVVEPFEVREIVALAESEFRRCRTEAEHLHQEIHLEIATRDPAIARANKTLERLLAESGLEKEKQDAVFYAVREAIDNARRHGNEHETERGIDIVYWLDREKLVLTVGDEGPGFDFDAYLERARRESPLEQARARHAQGAFGGLGIGLMLRCCDVVEYVAPGNVVKLTKYR